MADISSVKLPDASEYDVTDAEALHSSDPVNNLNSTSTTLPLAANMGHAIGENLTANENVYGAKNLIPYPYNETTKTENAITFTDNGDGTITVNGIASSDTNFFCRNRITDPMYLKKGTYKFTGCPSGGGSSSYEVDLIYQNSDGSIIYLIDVGNGLEFTVNGSYGDADGANFGVIVTIYNGANLTTPITFEPMIRDARIVDDTFVPFAKTNLQLTNDKAERADLATLNLTGSTNSTGAQIDEGTYFYLNGSYCKAITNIANGATLTLNTNFETVSVGGELFKITPRYITQIAVGATRSLTTELPRSYIIATYGSIGSALTIQTGVGYGKESSRHKTQSIINSSDVVYAVNDLTYGLDITNNTSTALTVSIIKLL